jgi:uncharacterized protein (DUF924 family)
MEIACPGITILLLITLLNKNTSLNYSKIHNSEKLIFRDSRFPYRNRMMCLME